jgi:hypothetical protein
MNGLQRVEAIYTDGMNGLQREAAAKLKSAELAGALGAVQRGLGRLRAAVRAGFTLYVVITIEIYNVKPRWSEPLQHRTQGLARRPPPRRRDPPRCAWSSQALNTPHADRIKSHMH